MCVCVCECMGERVREFCVHLNKEVTMRRLKTFVLAFQI